MSKKIEMFEVLKEIILIMAGALVSIYITAKYGSEPVLKDMFGFISQNIGELSWTTTLVVAELALIFLGAYIILRFIFACAIIFGNIVGSPLTDTILTLGQAVSNKWPRIGRSLTEYVKGQQQEYARDRSSEKFLVRNYYPRSGLWNFILTLVLIQIFTIIDLRTRIHTPSRWWMLAIAFMTLNLYWYNNIFKKEPFYLPKNRKMKSSNFTFR